MKNINHLIMRLKKMCPNNIKPMFNTGEELLAWQKEQGKIYSATIDKKNRDIKILNRFNRSGIRPLHKNCSFENYKIECQGQQDALNKARKYAQEFDSQIGSFIFSGKPGTGKNHLAAAICNELLFHGKTVLIITVADIMSAMKNTFKSNEASEEKLLDNFSSIDLLVIDEIGVQIESRYEKIIINQILERRSSSKLHTGMISNYNIDKINQLLGERIIDRMKLGNYLYIIFNWNSYRNRVFNK